RWPRSRPALSPSVLRSKLRHEKLRHERWPTYGCQRLYLPEWRRGMESRCMALPGLVQGLAAARIGGRAIVLHVLPLPMRCLGMHALRLALLPVGDSRALKPGPCTHVHGSILSATGRSNLDTLRRPSNA